jgi:tRNA dimethylallyltransferase
VAPTKQPKQGGEGNGEDHRKFGRSQVTENQRTPFTYIKIMNKKIIIITGPTASGKTSLAVNLCKKYGGEIISADSRQVYKGLDIGTGKDLKEYGDVPYYLIDICKPEERFTVFDFVKIAQEKIDEITARNKIPFVVGGTGLYIQALIEGFELKKNKVLEDRAYSREELSNKSLKQLQDIYNRLKIKNPKIDLKNPRRIISAIEKKQLGLTATKSKPDFEALHLAVLIPRKNLYEKIDARVEQRFQEGMLEEVEGLIEKGIDLKWLKSLGLEYGIIANFLERKNGESLPEMKQKLKYKIHAYARRQLTWLRRFEEIKWISSQKETETIIDNFIKK